MKYVVFYESADDLRLTAPVHFPAHQAHFQDFHERGLLLMIGTFGDPQAEGSMAVFSTREAAEQFARRSVHHQRCRAKLVPPRVERDPGRVDSTTG